MAIRDRAQVQREVDLAQSRLEKLLAELDNAPVLPREPERGSVINFTVQFDPGGPVYMYVAYRFAEFGDRWSLTGKGAKYDWKSLVELMARDHAVDLGHRSIVIQKVTGWEKVSPV